MPLRDCRDLRPGRERYPIAIRAIAAAMKFEVWQAGTPAWVERAARNFELTRKFGRLKS